MQQFSNALSKANRSVSVTLLSAKGAKLRYIYNKAGDINSRQLTCIINPRSACSLLQGKHRSHVYGILHKAAVITMKYGLHALVTLSAIEIFLFGGIIYGWGSYVFILKSEGFFSDLCTFDNITKINASITTTTSCSEQDERLNMIFAIALSLGAGLCFYIGYLNSRFGPLVTRLSHMYV